jgi:hypothetical protein
MTPEQQRLVKALNGCTMLPGSAEKRFVRSLEGHEAELSEKQAAWLERLRYRYRRQLGRIDPPLVADLPMRKPKVPTENELQKLVAWEEAARKFMEGDSG